LECIVKVTAYNLMFLRGVTVCFTSPSHLTQSCNFWHLSAIKREECIG